VAEAIPSKLEAVADSGMTLIFECGFENCCNAALIPAYNLAAYPVVDPEEWPEAVDLIFVTEFGRPVNVNSLVYKHFKPILKRAGLPNIRLYDLRHTAATLALTVGVSPKVVSEQLGHTSAAFTLDVYSHVLPHMQDDAAAKVEAVLMGN